MEIANEIKKNKSEIEIVKNKLVIHGKISTALIINV